MISTGPILVIDDDREDQHLVVSALEQLHLRNEILTFEDGGEALHWLLGTKASPFLILCDIKMLRMDGIELREKITKDPHLQKKSIPFVFISGSANERDVERAYELCVQGFFTKPNLNEEWEKMVAMIVNYWTGCIHPNS